MIKYKAKHLRSDGYLICLPGSDGEELVVITSWGSDFRTKLVIVSVSPPDGGVNVLHAGKARVNLAQVLTTVQNVVLKWSGAGKRPVDSQEELARQHKKLMNRFVKLWGHVAG